MHKRSGSIASTGENDAIDANPIAFNTMLSHSDNTQLGPFLNIDFHRLTSPNHPATQSSLAPALELSVHAEHEPHSQIITPRKDNWDIEMDTNFVSAESSAINNTTHEAGKKKSKHDLAASIQSLSIQPHIRLEAGVHPNAHGTSTSRAKSRERFTPGHQPADSDRDTLTDSTASFHQLSFPTSPRRVAKSMRRANPANPAKATAWPQRPTLNEALALIRWVVEKEKEKEDTKQARLHLAARQKIQCLKSAKEDLVKENDGRQKANADLQDKLNENERRIKEYEEKIGGVKKYSKGLENDLCAERSRYEDLRKELAVTIENGNKLAADRDNLRLQIQEAQAKFTELETEKNQLVTQLTEKDIISSAEKSRISCLEDQLGLPMQNAAPFQNCITDLRETISHWLGKLEAVVVAQNDPERRDLLRQLLGLVNDVHVRQNTTPDVVDVVRAEIENLRSR